MKWIAILALVFSVSGFCESGGTRGGGDAVGLEASDLLRHIFEDIAAHPDGFPETILEIAKNESRPVWVQTYVRELDSELSSSTPALLQFYKDDQKESKDLWVADEAISREGWKTLSFNKKRDVLFRTIVNSFSDLTFPGCLDIPDCKRLAGVTDAQKADLLLRFDSIPITGKPVGKCAARNSETPEAEVGQILKEMRSEIPHIQSYWLDRIYQVDHVNPRSDLLFLINHIDPKSTFTFTEKEGLGEADWLYHPTALNNADDVDRINEGVVEEYVSFHDAKALKKFRVEISLPRWNAIKDERMRKALIFHEIVSLLYEGNANYNVTMDYYDKLNSRSCE